MNSMLSFREIHALNPFLHLLDGLKPLFNAGDTALVREVFEWSHALECVEIARAARDAVRPAFEEEAEEHRRQINMHHKEFLAAKDSPSLRKVADKHIREHTEALHRMNLKSRLDTAQQRVDIAERKLQAAAYVLGERARAAKARDATFAQLTMVDKSERLVPA
jgi:hypothetical protein